MPQRYDAIIIGAGQAGPSLAGRLTAAGQKVALAERHLFGGTCVNTGCRPTKTLVASARAAFMARNAAHWGVVVPSVGIDMARVKQRQDEVVLSARKGNEDWLDAMDGLTVYRAAARLEGPNTVRIGDELLEAPKIFINVGGRARVPDLPGIKDVPYLTNSSLLAMRDLPDHLVIVGGSYVGLEFAQIYRRFGVTVTVVEMKPRIIEREDRDVCGTIQSILEAEGIAIRTGAECVRFEKRGKNVGVMVSCTEGEPEVVGSHVLLAVGRVPNTDDLGLEAAGIKTDARGFITVDDRLETNVPGVFALGECNGRGAFTHTAYNDFEIVAANLLDGGDRKLSQRIPAFALFVDPPLARVGLSPDQARAAGHSIKLGKRPMTRVGRAVERGETEGFMEIVIDAGTDRILGATILGVDADEAIHGIIDMMHAGATASTLQWAVPVHPTVSELIPTIVGEAKPG